MYMFVMDATERLARDYFGVETRHFSFAGHKWLLVLHFERGNLVVHVQKKDSLDLNSNRKVFCGVGIAKRCTSVMHHWHEAPLTFESPDRASARVWIGPSKSYLLQNGRTLYPDGVLWICFAMSEGPSSFDISDTCRKELIEKGRFSTPGNPTTVPQNGFDEREEDNLAPNLRALRSLSKNLKDMYLEDKEPDVKIIIGSKTLGAHRTILKARSPVLSAMFSNDLSEAHSGEVHLEDCHADDFAVFLLFLYSGTVEGLTSDNVLPVYDIADKYDVPGLVEACIRHMMSNLTVHSVSDVVGLALKHGDVTLLQEATDFFVQHAEEIFPTVEWQRFLADNPTQANELVIKSVSFMKSQNV